MSSVKKKKVLFVVHGPLQKVKDLTIQRLQKLGYLEKANVFTDINYEKSSHQSVWKKDDPSNALIDVTTQIDTEVKAEQIKKKFLATFTSVVIVELPRTATVFTVNDDDLRSQIEYGIALSDTSVSEEDRMNLFLSRRKKYA